jgi:hypothetical protein
LNSSPSFRARLWPRFCRFTMKSLTLINASLALTLILGVGLPYGVSAAAVIDLGPSIVLAAEEEPGLEVIEMRFVDTGKLLALMPVKFDVTVRVKPGGAVALEYPWYARLSVDRRELLTNELKVAVDNALRALTVGSVRAEGGRAPRSFSSQEAQAVRQAVDGVLERMVGTTTSS